jgi:GNAT superfamily N-acetyltransferase
VTEPATEFSIEPATDADVPVILGLIRELAAYEKLAREVVATEDLLRANLFGASSVAEAVLAREGSRPVGFAVFFATFSTFLGRPGIYLEDLYVSPDCRGRGCGGRLLAHVAGIARRRGSGRLEWSVLDWNRPAIDFYEKLGARPLTEWTMYRLTGDALERIGSAER